VDSYRVIPGVEVASRPQSLRKVLLIDDDCDNLEEMQAVLELRGYIVRTASSGAEGLHILTANGRIDAVVSDLGMPGMNG
jgi:CheY-like chemotaxis protein